MKKISVIGLGKLGSCMAAVYASKGFQVTGVDINQTFVDAINTQQAPVNELNLQEYISLAKKNLQATTDTENAIIDSEITFIIVPTPTDKTGGFSVEFVKQACIKIGKALKNKRPYHLVVTTSTVLPGDSENEIIPTLEKYSGKKCGIDFGYCYSPEFIAIGSVIHDLLNPDFYLIGEFDKKSGDFLSEFYPNVCDNQAPIERMNIPSAELTKIALNSYVTTKITFANILGEICDHIPGADIDKVTTALGKDKRISPFYLKCGLGFGGPCFPRDNVAFSYMAKKHGAQAPFAEITHSYNESMVKRISDFVLNHVNKKDRVAFLGLAYKPGTPVVEESHALKIVQKLVEMGFKVTVYEPAGYEHAQRVLGNTVVYAKDLQECLRTCNTYFISNTDKEFDGLSEFLVSNKDKTVIDPWRFMRGKIAGNANAYYTLGLGQ